MFIGLIKNYNTVNEILNCFPEIIKIYAVWSTSAVTIDDEDLLDIEPSRKVYDHSIEFAWGYCGNGPAQFALALLLRYIPERYALQYYQTFKEMVIAMFPNGTFYFTLNIRDHMARVIRHVDGLTQQELF